MKKCAFIDTPREETVNLAKYAFIDEPRDETVLFSEYAFLDDPVQTGFINTENIPPPPPYDGKIITENYPPPVYISYEGIEDPPKYQRNGWKIRKCKLLNSRTQHYLPSYDEIYQLSDYGKYKENDYYLPNKNYGGHDNINSLRNMELLPDNPEIINVNSHLITNISNNMIKRGRRLKPCNYNCKCGLF